MLSDNSHSHLARAPCYRLYFHFIFPTRLEFTWFSSNGRCTTIVRKHFMCYLRFGCVCFDERIAHVLANASISNAHGLKSRTMSWRCVMGTEQCEKGSRPSQATHSNPKRFNQSEKRDGAARAKLGSQLGIRELIIIIIIIGAFICMHISSYIRHATRTLQIQTGALSGARHLHFATNNIHFNYTQTQTHSDDGCFSLYACRTIACTCLIAQSSLSDQCSPHAICCACMRQKISFSFSFEKWCRRTRCPRWSHRTIFFRFCDATTYGLHIGIRMGRNFLISSYMDRKW